LQAGVEGTVAPFDLLEAFAVEAGMGQ
jgi:hypothetical protein